MPGGWRGTVVIIGMQGEPAAAEAGMMLQQPEARRVFFLGSCLWIMGPWQWRASQPPWQGVEAIWIVTCAFTQDSW